MIIILLFSLIQISGAGASFPAHLYKTWMSDYYKSTESEFKYESVGSGKGIELIKSKKVDFGASDDPLSIKEIDSLQLIQFPATIGAIVVVVNLSPIGDVEIKLTAHVLGDIFSGKITHWNDPSIISLNPEVHFPNKEIIRVCRNDRSGTTAVFTRYLSENNRDFFKTVGMGKKVNWPKAILADGNNGIIASISRIPFSIGYSESFLAENNHLNTVSIKNKNGQFVKPKKETYKKALDNIDWSKDRHFSNWIADKNIENAWPIMTATYIILAKKNKNNRDVCRFFNWCFKYQNISSEKLSFVLIPNDLRQMIYEYWSENEIIFDII